MASNVRRNVVQVVIVGAVLAFPQPAAAERVVVGFHPTATSAARGAALDGLARVADIGRLDATVVDVPAHAAARVRAALQRRPAVRYVTDDTRLAAAWTPNDPRLSSQWGLARVDAPDAWDTTRGSSGVQVAILDTGVDYTHPDLEGKVAKGRDFVAGDDDPFDEHGHGTHVAGIAAAATDNGVGMAGVAPDASLLAVRVLDANGSGYMSWIAQGVVHAADRGARVINLSLGGSSGSTTLRDAIVYARGKGAVVTCAAGNAGTSSLAYPAAYAECLSVGATDSSDSRASFSNTGSALDLVAPGVSILSTVPGGGYQSWSGTSMATPFASGAAALLSAQGLSGADVERALTSTALDLGADGHDTAFGHGRLRVAAAVGSVVSPAESEPGPTEPSPTEQAPSDPPPSQPAPAQPAPSAPAPAEPGPSEPVPAEPAPTEPAPASNTAPSCTSVRVVASARTQIRLRCRDAEGDPVAISLVSRPRKGLLSRFDPVAGTLTYTPRWRASGRDHVRFRGSDGALLSATATVSIDIRARTTATRTVCRKSGRAVRCTTYRRVRTIRARHGSRLVWVRTASFIRR